MVSGRLPALLILATLAAVAAGGDPPAEVPKTTDESPDRPTIEFPFQPGICWVGRSDAAGLAAVAAQGVGWISVTPFAYGHQESATPPEGGYRASRFRGESLAGMREIVREAHSVGLKVLLKPHVWFSTEGSWRGDIAMSDDAEWATWFRMYEEFLTPFVELCVEEEVAAICIGCELGGTISRVEEWRALIGRVRARYGGSLTYAANWHHEFQALPFWDALDWIGVQAYFPLSDSKTPTEEELRAGWEPWKKQLAELSKKHGKPIIFTEIGYRPEQDNARKPWEWQSSGELDPEAQARAFRALFSAIEGESWVGGIHVWKWFAGTPVGERPRRRRHDSFSPQGLPAEALIFEQFRKWGKPR